MANKAWRLIFAEGLLGNFISGKPAWTFRIYRPGSNDFIKGQIIEGHFKDGIMLLMEVLEEPKVKPFINITDQERALWNNGVSISHGNMMDIMDRHSPGVVNDTVAVLLKLRLAQIDERPVAGPLPDLP